MSSASNHSGSIKSDGDADQDAEYEVESIVAHRKSKGVEEFLIKWKGYESADNSWETSENISAPEMIEQFWVDNPPKHAAVAAKRKSSGGAKDTKEKKRKSPGAKSSEIAYTPEHLLDQDLLSQESWEDDVKEVGTIEGTSKDASFLVYLIWKDGLRSTHYSHVTNVKCPQKVDYVNQMIKFYEGHLKFSQ